MIYFNKITKTFKTDFWAKSYKALDDVSFTIPEGEIIGFLGENGAGKTTLIKILMGFTRLDSGELKFSECMGKDRLEFFQNIGFLPERPYFYPNLTGKEFVHYLGSLNKVPRKIIEDRLVHWSKRLSLYHALTRQIRTYSKGMMQRIGFISCLVHDPKLIILDEPLSGLDPIGRKEIKDVMLEINKEGKTIFFSSHIVPDVEQICKKVVFLSRGKILYDGDVNKLIFDSNNPTYSIQYSNLNNSFETLEVQASEKDEKLQNLLKQGFKIEMIYKKRLTLEEVFYKLKD